MAENAKGRFSSRWIFWPNRNDYYFGAKSVSGALKVSFHENGVGYLAFAKPYLEARRAEGIVLADKTILQWKLPIPRMVGAVHAASLILPADFCHNEALTQDEKTKTLVLGIEDGCAAEIGLFLSLEGQVLLESKFEAIGRPLVMSTLENGFNVSIVVRSRTFNRADLPTTEQINRAHTTVLQKEELIKNADNLNTMLWNDPGDGGTLQVLDVGGVRIERKN